MGKAEAARKLAATAAIGGGGLSALGASAYGLLALEAKLARRAIGDVLEDPVPDASGWYGRGRPGPAIKVALLGDSAAAGYGVDRVEDTPGAVIATSLAERADRRVYLKEFAVVGADTGDLMSQVESALPVEPEVAVINIGANDITHGMRVGESIRHLDKAVRRLRRAGVEVVVGTCPDLGTVKPIAPPLRQYARHMSRRLATAQSVAVVAAGGRTVSLGDILGPEFDAAPSLLFGPDRFHPSAEGYASLAAVMVPSVLAALGFIPDEEATPEALRGEGLVPISRAAAEAARTPGTELGGSDARGPGRGVRGLLVELRHRRRAQGARGEAPYDSDDAG